MEVAVFLMFVLAGALRFPSFGKGLETNLNSFKACVLEAFDRV